MIKLPHWMHDCLVPWTHLDTQHQQILIGTLSEVLRSASEHLHVVKTLQTLDTGGVRTGPNQDLLMNGDYKTTVPTLQDLSSPRWPQKRSFDLHE